MKRGNLSVRFKRPPKTAKEAIHVLQEADARFEQNKKYLTGELYRKTSLEVNTPDEMRANNK